MSVVEGGPVRHLLAADVDGINKSFSRRVAASRAASSVGQESAKKAPAWRVRTAPRAAILARALRSSFCAPVFMGPVSAILPFNGRETAATRRHGLPGHGTSLLRSLCELCFLASNFPQRYQGDFTQPCIFGTEFTCTRVEFTPALLGASKAFIHLSKASAAPVRRRFRGETLVSPRKE